MSLARLLGVEPGPASVSLTLSMSAAASSEPPPEVDAAAAGELAAHERARSKKRKAPEGPRGRSKATRITTEPKNVPKDSRITDFPDQGLKISAGTLFCQPCATTLPNIRGSIVNHLATKKHKSKLEAFLLQQASDKDLRSELSAYFEENSDERHVSVLPAHVPAQFDFSLPTCVHIGLLKHRHPHLPHTHS